MFRCAVVGVVLIGAMLAGCSSSEPLTIELSHSQQQLSRPFATSGPAVDEGVVWEIAEGTDSYSDFGGSGDAMVDLDADRAVYTGEIQP